MLTERELNNDPGAMVALSINALARGECFPLRPHKSAPVCHHFAPYADAILPNDLLSAPYITRLVKALETLDSRFAIEVIGGSFGIECWENLTPTIAWARERVPQCCEVAQQNGVHYVGWSWEPHGQSPVVASTNLTIVNG